MSTEFSTHRRENVWAEGNLRVEYGDAFVGLADDLTAGGVFIRTSNPMELGEQFPLKVHFPDSREPVEGACNLIRTNQYGKGSQNLRRGMGVKFLNLQAGVQRRVEEFIKSQKNFSLKKIG